MKELLETGVHFGHRTRKWNPKMGRYIFTERKGIHIIDLEQTVEMFRKAYYTIRDCVAEGGEILFVGTKKQVQATIADEAERCGAHYINRRWLGGTLTNFATIRKSIERMKRLEGQVEDGSIEHMPNKEASKLRRELVKLQRNLGGVRAMERKPNLMYIIDPDVETIAVHEANLAGVPIIAIVDTNCDPDPIDFLIPGNDDAIKATKLITARIADAVIEGREGHQDEPETSPTAQAPSEEDAEAVEEVAETEETGSDTAASEEVVAETDDEVAAAETSETDEAEAKPSESDEIEPVEAAPETENEASDETSDDASDATEADEKDEASDDASDDEADDETDEAAEEPAESDEKSEENDDDDKS